MTENVHQKLKAFLLAAGRGERLRPLTDHTPKCLLPINGRPLLQLWLEHLDRSGIDEVMINTHWLHEQVDSFVEKWTSKHKQLKINLFHEPELLGSGGTLLANRRWAGRGPFFIIYADNLTRLDLREMLDFHNKYKQPLTIRVYSGADPQRAGIVCIDNNNIVVDFEEKPEHPKSNTGAGGIYIADERIFDFFPFREKRKPGQILDLSKHILPRLIGRMKAYDSGEFSMDIGTFDSLSRARTRWSELMPDEV